MKKLLLLLILSSSITWSQVAVNQIDDFEDGTIMDWSIGVTPQPTNIPDGGPLGNGDNYLQYTTSGSPGGPGSKVIIYNRDQWTGDYTNQGIIAIKLDVKVEGSNDLNIRLAFSDETGQGTGTQTQICTTNPILVRAGTGWQALTFSVSSSDFTVVGGSGTVSSVLTNVAEARILHNDNPNWFGAAIGATLEVDNINASPTLGVAEVEDSYNFSIFPNPGKTSLNIHLAALNSDTNVEVFDILGKKIYSNSLNTLRNTINVSKWHSGVYLVRVSQENQVVTKRFVKQ